MRFALIALALSGCAGAPPAGNGPVETGPPPGPAMSSEVRAMIEASEAPFRVPGTVTARLGEELRIGDIAIRPLQVMEDSRCPVDVDCVWAGRIRVKVAVSGVGKPVMELDQQGVTLRNGVRLQLVAVAPPRWSAVPPGVDPNAPMRFGFRLTGMD